MSYHIHKDEIQLAWLDNRDTVKHMIRSLTRRVENEILRVLDDEFTAAVARGEVVELLPGSDEIRNLYVEAVKSQLDYNNDVPEAVENPDQLALNGWADDGAPVIEPVELEDDSGKKYSVS